MPCDFEVENAWHIDDVEVKFLNSDEVSMEATYYDTEDGLVANMHGALRIRRENDRTICCMKILTCNNGAYKRREEYEVESASIIEGLTLLPSKNAPADVCRKIAQSNIVVLCNIKFIRTVYRIEINHKMGNCVAEFAVDSGTLKRQKQAHFKELELEFISGSEDVFHLYATLIESLFSLLPEPRSKIARAMRL